MFSKNFISIFFFTSISIFEMEEADMDLVIDPLYEQINAPKFFDFTRLYEDDENDFADEWFDHHSSADKRDIFNTSSDLNLHFDSFIPKKLFHSSVKKEAKKSPFKNAASSSNRNATQTNSNLKTHSKEGEESGKEESKTNAVQSHSIFKNRFKKEVSKQKKEEEKSNRNEKAAVVQVKHANASEKKDNLSKLHMHSCKSKEVSLSTLSLSPITSSSNSQTKESNPNLRYGRTDSQNDHSIQSSNISSSSQTPALASKKNTFSPSSSFTKVKKLLSKPKPKPLLSEPKETGSFPPSPELKSKFKSIFGKSSSSPYSYSSSTSSLTAMRKKQLADAALTKAIDLKRSQGSMAAKNIPTLQSRSEKSNSITNVITRKSNSLISSSSSSIHSNRDVEKEKTVESKDEFKLKTSKLFNFLSLRNVFSPKQAISKISPFDAKTLLGVACNLQSNSMISAKFVKLEEKPASKKASKSKKTSEEGEGHSFSFDKLQKENVPIPVFPSEEKEKEKEKQIEKENRVELRSIIGNEGKEKEEKSFESDTEAVFSLTNMKDETFLIKSNVSSITNIKFNTNSEHLPSNADKISNPEIPHSTDAERSIRGTQETEKGEEEVRTPPIDVVKNESEGCVSRMRKIFEINCQPTTSRDPDFDHTKSNLSQSSIKPVGIDPPVGRGRVPEFVRRLEMMSAVVKDHTRPKNEIFFTLRKSATVNIFNTEPVVEPTAEPATESDSKRITVPEPTVELCFASESGSGNNLHSRELVSEVVISKAELREEGGERGGTCTAEPKMKVLISPVESPFKSRCVRNAVMKAQRRKRSDYLKRLHPLCFSQKWAVKRESCLSVRITLKTKQNPLAMARYLSRMSKNTFLPSFKSDEAMEGSDDKENDKEKDVKLKEKSSMIQRKQIVTLPSHSQTKAAAPAKPKPQEGPKNTRVQPFRLATEQRGAIKKSIFQTKVDIERAKEEALRIPQAGYLPVTVDIPQKIAKPPVKKTTKPLPFALDSVRRHNASVARSETKKAIEEAKLQTKQFKARPAPISQPPALPARPYIPVTEPKAIVFNTDIRAIERNAFDQQISERFKRLEEWRTTEEKKKKKEEQEELNRLRKTELIPKARPMPIFDNPFASKRTKCSKSKISKI